MGTFFSDKEQKLTLFAPTGEIHLEREYTQLSSEQQAPPLQLPPLSPRLRICLQTRRGLRPSRR